jgi:hypothetical protein
LRAALLALVGYVAITGVMFWSLLQHITNSFPMDLGDPPNEAWVVAWGVHALSTDPSQLLGGNIYYPHANALIYNDNLLGLLPFAVPVYRASGGNTALTYNVLFLLSFVLCGFTTYLLARYLTRSGAAGFLAGLIVAYCPYRMVHLSHLNQLSGAWLPLCFLFLERTRMASRPGSQKPVWPELVGFGISLGLQFLCSIYYTAFFLVCLVLYVLFYALRDGWWPLQRFVIGIAAAIAGTTFVLLPVISAYLQLRGRVDAVRGPEQVLYFSADLRDFLHMPTFSTLYGWTSSVLGVPTQDAHQYLFPGVIALLLALIAWRHRKLLPDVWVYLLLVLITAVLSLGRQLKAFDRVYNFPLPYRLLYDYTPGFQGFRDPARFFYIGFICLALLAAWGFTILLAHLAYEPSDAAPQRRSRTLPPQIRRVIVAAVVCGAVLVEYWINPIDTPHVAVGNAIPPEYLWLQQQPAGTPILELPIGQQNATIWSEQAMMTYYASYHWQPIVNGVGGYTPDGYDDDVTALSDYPGSDALALLRAWHVRYVFWHSAWMKQPAPHNGPETPVVHVWPDGTIVYAVPTW